mmetsp:Transcript_52482/g.128267  ORF Transcript_52482/g.128267 Transcript_52482/m.128267 type:complete len:200 (-) Transcript_52482:104-703(-)
MISLIWLSLRPLFSKRMISISRSSYALYAALRRFSGCASASGPPVLRFFMRSTAPATPEAACVSMPASASAMALLRIAWLMFSSTSIGFSVLLLFFFLGMMKLAWICACVTLGAGLPLLALFTAPAVSSSSSSRRSSFSRRASSRFASASAFLSALPPPSFHEASSAARAAASAASAALAADRSLADSFLGIAWVTHTA